MMSWVAPAVAGEPCICNRSPDIDAGIEEPDTSQVITNEKTN